MTLKPPFFPQDTMLVPIIKLSFQIQQSKLSERMLALKQQFSPGGGFCSPGTHGQGLETFLDISTAEALLTSSG